MHTTFEKTLGTDLVALISYTVFGIPHNIVVLKHTNFDNLLKAKKTFEKHRSTIMSMTDFKEGVDVFPIEFLHMKEYGVVHHGDNIIKDLDVEKKNLRHQLEYELRSKRIHLKDQCLHGKPETFAASILPTLGPLLNALLFYKEGELEDDITVALSKIEKAYSMDLAFLKHLVDGSKNITKTNYHNLLSELDAALKSFISVIN